MWIKRPQRRSDGNRSGAQAELEAESYLQQQGLSPKERNYSCKAGEIDLLMWDGSTLVFVEVRYRKDLRFGSPAETIDHHKQRKLTRAAQHYLQAKKLHDRVPCRFDVVTIAREQNAEVTIQWIQNAF